MNENLKIPSELVYLVLMQCAVKKVKFDKIYSFMRAGVTAQLSYMATTNMISTEEALNIAEDTKTIIDTLFNK